MFLAFGARLHLRQSLQRLVVVAHDSLILHGNCPFLPAGMHLPVVALAEGTLPWVVAHWLRAFQTCSQFVVHLGLAELHCNRATGAQAASKVDQAEALSHLLVKMTLLTVGRVASEQFLAVHTSNSKVGWDLFSGYRSDLPP